MTLSGDLTSEGGAAPRRFRAQQARRATLDAGPCLVALSMLRCLPCVLRAMTGGNRKTAHEQHGTSTRPRRQTTSVRQYAQSNVTYHLSEFGYSAIVGDHATIKPTPKSDERAIASRRLPSITA